MSARSRIGIGLGMCAIASLLGSNAVLAQGPAAPAAAPTGTVQERLTALEEKTNAEGLWKTLGFKLSGGVSASYNHNFNNPNTNLSQLYTHNANTNTFTPNLAQIMLERVAVASGSGADRAGFRARLNFGSDARYSLARTNFIGNKDNTEVDAQELYADYIVPIGNGLRIQAGKMNTMLGFETFTSWENPNFARTFNYNLGQTFTNTGLRATYVFNPMLTVGAGLYNGWDNIEDNNKSKQIEGYFTLTLHPRFVNFFYATWTPEQSNNRGFLPFQTGADPTSHRLTLDYINTTQLTDKDTFILELHYANETNASFVHPGKNSRWNGAVAYLNHNFTDQWALNSRAEIFEDAGGTRVCTGAILFNGGNNTCANSPLNFNNTGVPFAASATGGTVTGLPAQVGGIPLTVWDITETLQFKPTPALITRTEFRYEHANKDVFLNGSRPTNHQETLTFNVVYLY